MREKHFAASKMAYSNYWPLWVALPRVACSSFAIAVFVIENLGIFQFTHITITNTRRCNVDIRSNSFVSVGISKGEKLPASLSIDLENMDKI